MDISSIKSSLVTANAGVAAERTHSSFAVAAEVGERKSSDAATDNLAKVGGDPQAARQDVEAAVATIQDFVQSVRRDLNFSLEEGSGRVVVKVTDAGSGDVIRQIPSEEALQLAENLSEVRSLLFKAEA